MALLLALVSSVAIGGADFLGGRAAARASAISVIALAQTVDLVLLGALAAVLSLDPTAADLWLGAGGGIIGALAFVVFLVALARGPMSLVSPFTALIGVATPFVGGLVRGERPSIVAWAGCLLGALAILITSRPPRSDQEPAREGRGLTLLLAGVSGLGFGSFVVVLDATSRDAGIAPLVSARIAGVSFLVLLALARRVPILPPRVVRNQTLLMGVLETISVGCLIEALHRGDLTLVGVISSLYPVTTVLLATMLLGERLERIHRIGVVLAMVAVGLIAAG